MMSIITDNYVLCVQIFKWLDKTIRVSVLKYRWHVTYIYFNEECMQLKQEHVGSFHNIITLANPPW